MNPNVVVIDGTKFNNFEEFVSFMNTIAFDNFKWNGNLDALNDLLVGGFGNIIETSSIHWINSTKSKKALGYNETTEWIKKKLISCHPSNKEKLLKDLSDSQNNIGETLFDIIKESLKNRLNVEKHKITFE